MSILTIVQVRIGSTRLPGKALMPIRGKPMFLHVVEAAPTSMVVAIPQGDLILKQICDGLGVLVASRPESEDVLGRFVEAVRVAIHYHDQAFTHVLRLTGDCPMLTRYFTGKFIYMCEIDEDTIWTNRPLDPDGLDMELFPVRALLGAHEKANSPYDREHITPPLYRALETKRVRVSDWDPLVKVSVDTKQEYLLVKSIMEGRTKEAK